MFLLTEGTLFFLDLALSARVHDQKPSLSSAIQTWADEVAAATDDSGHGVNSTSEASSTSYAAPPACASATVGQTSHAGTSHGLASGPMLQNASVFTKRSKFPVEDSRQLFPQCRMHEEHGGETATNNHGGTSMQSSGMAISSNCDSNSGRCDPYVDTLLYSRRQEAQRALKRKIDDTDIVSDIGPTTNKDDDMEFITEDASQVSKTIGSAITKWDRVHTPPSKKVKYEDEFVSLLSAPLSPTAGRVLTTCTAQRQFPLPQRGRTDNRGHIAEAIGNHTQHMNSLPVPCDQRWSHFFVSTAILWYSVQNDIWNVPTEELTSAFQRIFDVVYPDVKYRVTPTGTVFALTLQRINEWRSSFGSSALAIMLHFFSALDNNNDIRAAAEFLATDFRFLREDPDSTEPSEPFRSAFILTLVAIAHLHAIAAFVDVPGWDTKAMAVGRGGEGVIALASAALERALRFFCNGTLEVDQVLAQIPRFGDTPTAVGPGEFQKTMLDTLSGHDVPAALRFSSANWSGHTAAYRESVQKRGATFVHETFAAAQARWCRIAPDTDSELGANVSVSGIPDPRVLL